MPTTTPTATASHRDGAPDAILIHETDNVAVCLEDIAAGAEAAVMAGKDTLTVTATDAVPRGHKIAMRDIAEGESILKYGEVIGKATQTIGVGNHVHRHNVID
jgi:altronate dehydratase small subunit